MKKLEGKAVLQSIFQSIILNFRLFKKKGFFVADVVDLFCFSPEFVVSLSHSRKVFYTHTSQLFHTCHLAHMISSIHSLVILLNLLFKHFKVNLFSLGLISSCHCGTLICHFTDWSSIFLLSVVVVIDFSIY